MGIGLDASANTEEVVVDLEMEMTGTIEFDIDKTQRDFPIHIVFCIDTSGSMSASIDADGLTDALLNRGSGTPKIEVAKEGVIKASQQLSSDDRFGVVAFSSSARTVVSSTPGNKARRVKSNVESLSSGGGTDIQAGLQTSKDLLDEMGRTDAIKWIVLVSDGKGSVPSDRQLRQRYSEQGVTIQAAGVGDDYDPDTLMNVAQQTQGESEHIKSGKGLRKFFREKVTDARNVVALDPELELTPTEATSIREVYYTLGEQQSMVDPEWRGDTCVIDLADVNQEKPPKVMLDLQVEADRADLDVPVVEATLTTKSDRVSDRILVDVVTEHLVDDVTAKPAKNESVIVSELVSIAQRQGASSALSELEDYRDEIASDTYRETKARLEELRTDDSGEATAKVSRLPSKLDK